MITYTIKPLNDTFIVETVTKNIFGTTTETLPMIFTSEAEAQSAIDNQTELNQVANKKFELDEWIWGFLGGVVLATIAFSMIFIFSMIVNVMIGAMIPVLLTALVSLTYL